MSILFNTTNVLKPKRIGQELRTCKAEHVSLVRLSPQTQLVESHGALSHVTPKQAPSKRLCADVSHVSLGLDLLGEHQLSTHFCL